jgi:methylglutaconyl-CoA hydratase
VDAVTDSVTLDRKGAVATVTLDRPELHNAFDDFLIAELTKTLRAVGEDPGLRVVVLAAAGASFSAGADLGWMRRMAGYGEAENLADAQALADLLAVLDTLPKPVLGVVQGAAFGGGVGLIACCDIAIAAETAMFALSEVRLGLIPATIGPYMVRAIGQRACRRYFLTAERFTAAEALHLGLVHQIMPKDQLAAARDRMVANLLECGPKAQAAAKDLIFAVADRPIGPEMIADTASRIAGLRASPEAREGLAAFLAKRKPDWRG